MKINLCPDNKLPKRDETISLWLILLGLLIVALCLTLSSPFHSEWAAFGFTLFVLNMTNYLVLKIPFFPYDRVLSATSNEDQLVWHKEPGVRVDVGKNKQVYYPKVITLNKGWRMYYRAGGNRSYIASAYSPDGLDWTEEQGIRISHKDCNDDIVSIEGCDVVESEKDKRLMYFSATDGICWRIYLSESDNGLNWTKGIRCIDVSENKKDSNVKAPSVIKLRQGGWQMFFMKFSNTTISFCTTLSSDGFVWSKPITCKGIETGGIWIRNPLVTQREKGLRMYFSQRRFKSDPLGAEICSAISLDGIHWEREEGVRIGPGINYDRHGIFNVDIIPTDSGYRMYYTGYWGRHWLESMTLRYYRKMREEFNEG